MAGDVCRGKRGAMCRGKKIHLRVTIATGVHSSVHENRRSRITTVPFDEATGRLRNLYERVAGPDNNVNSIMMMYSHQTHPIETHMTMYKNELHHSANEVSVKCLGYGCSSATHPRRPCPSHRGRTRTLSRSGKHADRHKLLIRGDYSDTLLVDSIFSEQ